MKLQNRLILHGLAVMFGALITGVLSVLAFLLAPFTLGLTVWTLLRLRKQVVSGGVVLPPKRKRIEFKRDGDLVYISAPDIKDLLSDIDFADIRMDIPQTRKQMSGDWVKGVLN